MSHRRWREGRRRFRPTLMLNRQRHPVHAVRPLHARRQRDAQINILNRGYASEIAAFREGVHSLFSNLMNVVVRLIPLNAEVNDYWVRHRPIRNH